MYRYLLVMVLLLHLNVYGQIDQKKLDSLSRAIDSSAKSHKSWQDSFIRSQYSIYQSAVNKNDLQKRNEVAKRNGEERQKFWLRIIVAVFVIAMIIALLRKRKARI